MAKISKSAARGRIAELSQELRRHNYNYYVLNSPVISDFEFDVMMNELQTLEQMFPEFILPDSPTQVVGSDIAERPNVPETAPGPVPTRTPAASPAKTRFVQVRHRYPMMSIGNTYNLGDMREFCNRTGADEFSCELKFDGTAICLTYLDGRLQRAVTRGDGEKGDNVLDNVLTISSIPATLKPGSGYPREFEIRGEIFMPLEAFDRLNREKEEIGEPPFANPRNAAAGSLKLQSPQLVAQRGLDCILYHILGEDLPFASHSEAISAAASWGLPVSEHARIVRGADAVIDYINQWDSQREHLPYATDGVVVKVNNLALQRQLGYTAKSPRWATAYKFTPEQALTELQSIDYQVGRTGAVTPVANLAPVQLSGTIVKRATLHNSDQMARLDLHIGDWVYVEKGGEIIPKITGVELSKRPVGAALTTFPTLCPDCGTPLAKDEEAARHYCPNALNCPTQIKSAIIHFASRDAMDILAGDATISQLYDLGLVRRVSDLYRLTTKDLLNLEGWQKKSCDNFLDSLKASLEVPFDRTLYALGIKHIGKNIAKLLARRFRSIEALSRATREELLQVSDIGDVICDSILEWFANPLCQSLVAELQLAGLQFELSSENAPQHSNVLSGKTIVISGTFSVSRDKMKETIELCGGRNTSSVSGKTSFLLAGDNPGPEKISKAEALGVRIIDEATFNEMISKV
ncbi:MAG: NAD-dependent DNA ligase LigA [Bacteroidales bacterium]|nr:NAD-dependent DNA ligase LigA [Bacteroidales bacterium]